MESSFSLKKFINTTSLTNVNSFINDIFARETNRFSSFVFEFKNYRFMNNKLGHEFSAVFLTSLLKEIIEKTKEYGKLYHIEGGIFTFLLKYNITIEEINELNNLLNDVLINFECNGYKEVIEFYSGALYDFELDINDKFKSLTMISFVLEKAKNLDSDELIILDVLSYDKEMKELKLLETIKNSIYDNCNGFYLAYQPFVSAMNGKVIGAEALLRWKNDEYGTIMPGKFISYIEDNSCFYDLGIWIIRQTLSDFKDICLNNSDFFVNINLSYSQLERKEFKDDVINIIEEVGFPITNLQLELTERCKNLNIKYLKNELDFFKEKGIRIALDDFGTGTSTLRLICDLPIDCVKIDQSFIINIINNPSNAVIVETILECAKRLGISVCLEGVENQEIKDYVSKYYANYHQGFYYSKPIDLVSFKEMMHTKWITNGIKLVRSMNKASFEVNSILSMMPGGFFIYLNDPTERIILCNEALLDIYECNNVEEFIELTNNRFSGMVHPDDYKRVDQEIKDQISKSTKKYDKVKYRIITKNGNIKYVADYGHLVTKDYNDDIFYVFIVEDVK